MLSYDPETRKEHVALVKDDGSNKTPLVRMHSECLTGDVFHSLKCDCGDQLTNAMEYIEKGNISMKMRSAHHTCIGAINGSVNTKITNAEINIDSEGDEMTGIGDVTGTGNISIIDSTVNMTVFAGNPKDIGTSSGDLQIQNSSVNSLINNQRVAH